MGRNQTMPERVLPSKGGKMIWPFATKAKRNTMLRAELMLKLPKCETAIAEDRAYILPSNSDVFSALGTDWSKYLAEINDCDDYVWRAKGKAAGRGWPFAAVKVVLLDGTAHYICGWINDRREWVLFEPQTREMFTQKIQRIIHIVI